jgi:hypothetical protein
MSHIFWRTSVALSSALLCALAYGGGTIELGEKRPITIGEGLPNAQDASPARPTSALTKSCVTTNYVTTSYLTRDRGQRDQRPTS